MSQTSSPCLRSLKPDFPTQNAGAFSDDDTPLRLGLRGIVIRLVYEHPGVEPGDDHLLRPLTTEGGAKFLDRGPGAALGSLRRPAVTPPLGFARQARIDAIENAVAALGGEIPPDIGRIPTSAWRFGRGRRWRKSAACQCRR
jgi:hypothetical protein